MVDTAAGARADMDALIRDRVDAMVTARVDEIMALKEAEKAAKPKKMAIIATKGTLDWAYPPLILATTAKTLGWDVGIFFTFYGLKILQKDRHLEVGTTEVAITAAAYRSARPSIGLPSACSGAM